MRSAAAVVDGAIERSTTDPFLATAGRVHVEFTDGHSDSVGCCSRAAGVSGSILPGGHLLRRGFCVCGRGHTASIGLDVDVSWRV